MRAKLSIGLFTLAGISLLAQESKPSPFQPVLDALDPQTPFHADVQFKVPLNAGDEAPNYMEISGTVGGGPQEGKKYEARCVNNDCTFILQGANNGQLVLRQVNKSILVTADLEQQTANAKDYSKDPRVLVEIIDPEPANNTTVGICFKKERTIFLPFVPGEPSDKPPSATILEIDNCDVVPQTAGIAGKWIAPEIARKAANALQELNEGTSSSGFPEPKRVTVANKFSEDQKGFYAKIRHFLKLDAATDISALSLR